MAYSLFSEKDLSNIEKGLAHGDTFSYDLLFNESKKVAKAANSRILRLEKADYLESNAYQRATYYTEYAYGSERFRVNRSMSPDDLLEQYREMRTFMRKESSTVTGMKAAQARVERYIDENDFEVPKEDRRLFFKFLNADAVQDVIEMVGDSDKIIDAIANGFDKIKADFNGVISQFNAMLRGEVFYDELLERLGGMSFETLAQRSRNRGGDFDSRIARKMRNRNASKDVF